MKSRRPNIARRTRPSICTATIATALMVFTQVGPFAPSALAATFTTPFGTVETAAVVTGTQGVIMNGGGLLLLNSGNNYTGTTVINDGSVSITAATALGTDPSTITIDGPLINGLNLQATRGAGGGNLTVGGGITIGRNFFVRGTGSTGDTGAITSVGNNTFSGSIATGTAQATRLMSTVGTATFSGPITLGLGQTFQVGGNGNTLVSGNISLGSTSALQKVSGGGLLELTGNNTYGGITTVTAGFLRISSSANIGTNTGNTAITSGGGTLEIRSDAPDFAAKGLTQSASGTIFLDHTVGGSALNQQVAFRTLVHSAAGLTTTLNGRNGYGVSFGTGLVGTGSSAVVANQAGNAAIANNLNGLATYDGLFWNINNTTARTFTLSGNGDSLINGDIQARGAAHILTKSGTGTLTILSSGTGSNFTGTTNIQGGTIAIDTIKALNNAATGAASRINIGNGATAGTLTFIGAGAAADYTVAKTVNMIGTTGSATINANQSSVNPVLISAFSVIGVGNKTLTLGGTNAADNQISGAITNGGSGVTSLTKSGPGTWVLSGNNTYGGATTITNGTLKLNATAAASNIIASGTANTIVFNADATQSAGGILQFTGVGTTTTETLGALTPTAGMGTVRLTSGGAAANLVFTSLAGGSAGRASGVNFDTAGAGGGTVTLTGVPISTATTLAGNGHFYINGADFARSNGGVLVAPVYGIDAGFVDASAGAATLGAGNHNRITGDITAQTAVSITSLKMSTNTLTLAGNLTVNTGGAANDGGILVSGGNTATIATSGAFGITTGGAGALVFRVNAPADVLTLSAPMLSTMSGGLTKNGAGALILSAANLQTGATTINEGTVRLQGAGTLSANNQALAVRQGGALDLNGVSTGAAVGAFTGAGTITNGSSAVNAALTVGNNNGTGTFSGVIMDGTGGGVISVVKNGTGAQTWSGLNTYTGSTTFNSTGIVSVTSLANGGVASSIGASGSAASNIIFSGASATGATGGISYTGAATVSTDRLFTLGSQAAGGTGGGRIQANGANNAALIFSNTGPIAITGTTAQTLTLGGTSTGDNRMNPQLVDGAGAAILNVRKDDAGLWILGNTGNTYTGTTLIVNGQLQAAPGALGAGGLILGTGTSGTGVFQSSGTLTRTIGTGPGTVSWGSGTSGAMGFAASAGKFDVNIGAGTWDTGSFVKNGVALLLNSATALGEVNYQGDINLNGASRTIQVDDNASTASDFATISGGISGAAGSSLVKTGGGLLNLRGANSYAGNTDVRAGTITVTSLGQSSGIGTSSVGAWGAGAVQLGFNTAVGTLEYVGAGETSSRLIQATGSSGQTTVIRSNGTGALILANLVSSSVAVGTAGRQIGLGGENTGPNEVTSILADAGGGPLSVVKNDGGVWNMTRQHTYTGTTTISSGALGIGANGTGLLDAPTSGPFGIGTLVLNNGSLMAVNGDRTIINRVSLGGATSGIMGDNSIIIDSTATAVGASILNNFLPAGKTLTLNGTLTNDATARSVTFQGSGSNIINGLVTQSGSANLSLALNATGGGSLRIGGSAGPNSYGGATTLTAGTLILDKVGAIGATGTAAIFNMNGGILQATSDAKGVITNSASIGGSPTISGTSSIDIQGTVTQTGGNRTLTNSLPSGKFLTFSGPLVLSNTTAARVITFTGAGNTNLSGTITEGAGAGSLTKAGTGTITFSGVGSDYTGRTTIQDGLAILAGGGNNRLPDGGTLILGSATTFGVLQLGDSIGPAIQALGSVGLVGVNPFNAIVGGNAATSTLNMSNEVDTALPLPIGGNTGGFSDNIRLVKTGAGNLTLNLVNTYKGGTQVGTPNGIDGGTLTLDGAGTLGDDTVPTALTVYGGTMDFRKIQEVTSLNLGGGAASSTARVVLNADLLLNGNITYSALNNPNPASIEGAAALDLNPNADTLVTVGASLSGSAGALAPDLTISSAFIGNGWDLRKQGLGTLRLVPNLGTTFSERFFVDTGTAILDGGPGGPVFGLSVDLEVAGGAKLDLGNSVGDTVAVSQLTLKNNSSIVYNLGALGAHDNLDVLSLILDPGASGLKVDINALTGFGSGGTGGTVRYRLMIEDGTDITGTKNPFLLGAKPGGFNYNLGTAVVTSGTYELFLDVTKLAAGFFWKGGANANWNTPGNWVNAQTGGALINGVPGLSSDVVFSADSPSNAANTTVNVNMGVNTLSINTAPSTVIKGLSSTILSIANGLTVNPSAGAVTLGGSLPADRLFLGVVNSQSWTNNGSGTLTVLNQVFSQNTGIQTLTIAGSGRTVIDGNIIDGGLGGKIALAKTSADLLTLSNPNNTYTGGTRIGAGILEFASGGLALSGTIQFNGNAALRWLSGNSDDISGRLLIGNGFTATLDTNGNNVNFVASLQPGTPTTGALTKAGAGTLTLAGAGGPAGYGGGTNISGGTLAFNAGALPASGNVSFAGDSTLRWNSINSTNLSSRIRMSNGITATIDTNGNDVTFATALVAANPSTGALIKAGLGTLALAHAGVAAGYTGGTSIAGGTLEFAPGTLPAAGFINITGNAALRWAASNTNDVSNRLQISGGVTGTIDTNGNDVTFSSSINDGNPSTGALTKAGGGKLNLAAPNPFYAGATTVQEGALLISGSIVGSASVNVSAGATLELGGLGDRISNSAPINLGAGPALDPAILLANAVGETMGTLTLGGDAIIDLGLFDSSAQMRFASSSSLTWTGGLSLWNWTGNPLTGGGADQVFFGSNASGLNAGQLSVIQIFSDDGITLVGPAGLTSVGELVAVPEPGSVVSLLGGVGLLLGLRRRRR